MKTVRLNVFEQQRKWLEYHRHHADSLVCNAKGEAVQATYRSPLEQWRNCMASDGTVLVPDMNYYNSLTDVGAIQEAIAEIFPTDLRTENEQLRAIAQVIATHDMTWYDGLDQYCIFCMGEENFADKTRFHHTDECIVTRARAIMQKSDVK